MGERVTNHTDYRSHPPTGRQANLQIRSEITLIIYQESNHIF